MDSPAHDHIPIEVGPHEGTEEDEAPRSPWHYASVALRRRYLIVALMLGGGAAAGVLSLSSARVYTASTTFVPQEPASAQAGLGQLASQFGFSTGRVAMSSPQFYADLLLSRQVLRDVLQSPYTVHGPRPFQGDLIRFLGIRADSPSVALRIGMQLLRKRMNVRVDRATGVVQFRVSTVSGELSEQVARRFVELLNDYNLRRRQSQARAERDFVQQRLASAEEALTQAEENVAAFLRRNRRFTDSPELVAEEARLQRRVTVRQQIYLNLNLSLENAKIEEVRDTPVLTVVEPPEGLVEPRARGSVRKAVLGTLFGALIGFALALLADRLSRVERKAEGYQEFMRLWRETLRDLRGGWHRRRSA